MPPRTVRQDGHVANEAGKRLMLLGWALTLLVLAFVGLALFIFTITGFGLVLVSIGIPIASSYRPPRPGNVLVRLWGVVRDPATWRDVLWLLVNSIAGLTLTIVATVEAVFGLLFWWWPKKTALYADAQLIKWLLSPSK